MKQVSHLQPLILNLHSWCQREPNEPLLNQRPKRRNEFLCISSFLGRFGTYPLGGVAWDYLQFVSGFVSLGCEVTYLEDTGSWVYHPQLQTFTDDSSENVRHLQRVLATVPGMASSFAFRDPRGVLHGLSEERTARRCREADLL